MSSMEERSLATSTTTIMTTGIRGDFWRIQNLFKFSFSLYLWFLVFNFPSQQPPTLASSRLSWGKSSPNCKVSFPVYWLHFIPTALSPSPFYSVVVIFILALQKITFVILIMMIITITLYYNGTMMIITIPSFGAASSFSFWQSLPPELNAVFGFRIHNFNDDDDYHFHLIIITSKTLMTMMMRMPLWWQCFGGYYSNAVQRNISTNFLTKHKYCSVVLNEDNLTCIITILFYDYVTVILW